MIDFLHFTYPNFFTEPLTIAAFLFATSSISLAWMASEFFSMPTLKAFAKHELRELGITLVILLLAIGLTLNGSLFDLVGRGLAPSHPATSNPNEWLCPEWVLAHGPVTYDASSQTWQADNGNVAFGESTYFLGCYTGYGQWFSYLSGGAAGSRSKGVLAPKLVDSYVSLTGYEIASGFASTFGISITLVKGLYTGFPVDVEFTNLLMGVVMNPVNEANTMLTDILGSLISAAFAQKMLLTFIETSVPTVILPLGLVMRTFPFTRKTGSTIVAFAFAAYFIYPLSVLVNAKIYESLENPQCAAGLLPAGQACTQDADCCSGLCTGKCESPVGSVDKYKSTLAFCGSTDLRGNQAQIDAVIAAEQGKELAYAQGSNNPVASTPVKGSLTEAQLKNAADELNRRVPLEQARLLEGVNNTFLTPGKVWMLYRQFEWLVIDTAKQMVLIALFIVVEIVVTLTLYKDFSGMIGGEPRIMGISKLV